jgi:hypothetical protein
LVKSKLEQAPSEIAASASTPSPVRPISLPPISRA